MVPKWIWKIMFLFVVILTLISYGGASTLEKIVVGDVADMYQTIQNFYPAIDKLSSWEQKWIFILLDAILILFIIYKRPNFVISHQSMGFDLAPIDKEFRKDNWLFVKKLQQTDDMKKLTVDSDIVTVVDDMAIKAQKSKYQVVYYGVAHTPLVFRLGLKYGDQDNVKLLHKKRSNDDEFEEWGTEKTGIWITPQETNASKKSDELIVAIGTSFEIKKEELKVLQPDNKHVLCLQTNLLGFDTILSYEDAQTLRMGIWGQIRQLVKKYSIKKIHMVISSSVAFTFFLAQGYSEHHDPEIIVYHYDKGKYTWGINMSEQGKNAYIAIEEQDELS